MTKTSKIVIAFGSFDGFHEGHRFFIEEVKKLGDKIIIAVAPDEVIELIKKRKPKFPLPKRMADLQQKFPEIKVISADRKVGDWEIVKKLQPDIIAIGYDQLSLKESLENSVIKSLPEIVVIGPHYPQKFKSSFL